MRRWQNLFVILALFSVAGAVYPWAAFNRIVCAAIAFALVLIVLTSRLQQHASTITGTRASIEDMQSRISRIREERERRYGRR